ncbi:MAG: hypothetical protein HYZ43_14270 [Flavobacteriia bacterium]|nr:hypothetical protein [Flavobacteriia bacterium]
MSVTKLETRTVKSEQYDHINFGTTVINASTALQGFSVSFGVSVDHHVKGLNMSSSITNISGNTVGISAVCTMEDNSNHTANGECVVLVLAECNS